jgi:hypothetical protein
MKAAGAIIGLPRELRTRHNMRPALGDEVKLWMSFYGFRD